MLSPWLGEGFQVVLCKEFCSMRTQWRRNAQKRKDKEGNRKGEKAQCMAEVFLKKQSSLE